jgi:peptidoglycan/xylan/chitin deacetylase (PgdA/CDA1 family)
MNALAARRLLRQMERWLPATTGVTVLAYHLVDAGGVSVVDLPARVFRSQMAMLARDATLLSSRGDQFPSTPHPVALTFDDAYGNFYDEVWPVLREHDLPATLYVPYDFIEGRGHAPIANTEHLPPCTWAQLREMQSDGLSIGSHSITHRNLLRLSDAESRREIEDSKEMLQDRLGCAVDSFCYPQAKWARRLEPYVRRSYHTAVIGGGWKYRPVKTSPHRIPRVSIRSDMPCDLTSLLRAPVCLEELVGDMTRRVRR